MLIFCSILNYAGKEEETQFGAKRQTGNSLKVNRGQALPAFGVRGVHHHVGHVAEMSRFNARRSGCCSNEEVGATPRGRTSPVFGLPKHRIRREIKSRG